MFHPARIKGKIVIENNSTLLELLTTKW